MYITEVNLPQYILIIKEWLIEEKKKFNSGFFCNWNFIEKCVNSNRALCLIENELPIGFVCWSCYGQKIIEIDILEIHPDFRKRGYGRAFVELIIDYFRDRMIMAIKLFCAPESSFYFWQNIGFNQFSNGYDSRIYMYKTIIDSAQVSPYSGISDDSKCYVDVWDVQPHRNSLDPLVSIEVCFKQDSTDLIKPIIYPANYDWNMRYRVGNKVIKEDGVKYFTKERDEFCVADFLIIQTIDIEK